MTNQALVAALEARKPSFKDWLDRMIRSRHQRLVEQFGPSLRGVYNSEH